MANHSGILKKTGRLMLLPVYNLLNLAVRGKKPPVWIRRMLLWAGALLVVLSGTISCRPPVKSCYKPLPPTADKTSSPVINRQNPGK